MSDKKYVVSEGGLDAAKQVLRDKFAFVERDNSTLREYLKTSLEAVIRWKSENPKVFSDEWIVQLVKDAGCADLLGANQFVLGMHQILDLFQRRMYLAPEPEVPEEIKDLLCGGNINTLITEAYRRGKQSKGDNNA